MLSLLYDTRAVDSADIIKRQIEVNMRYLFNALKVIAISLLLNGCASQTFTISGSTSAEPTDQGSQNSFIHGLGQEHVTDAAKLCGGAEHIIKVETNQAFINGLLATITWGIYMPRDAKDYCNAWKEPSGKCLTNRQPAPLRRIHTRGEPDLVGGRSALWIQSVKSTRSAKTALSALARETHAKLELFTEAIE